MVCKMDTYMRKKKRNTWQNNKFQTTKTTGKAKKDVKIKTS